MYPTAVVYDDKQRADRYPGPVPVSGLPNISSTPHYARPYVHTGSGVLAHGVAGRWSTDLCHCFDDPANCLTTCFCPCMTFGQIAEIVNRGSPSCVSSGAIYGLLGLTGFACLFSCFNRSKLRGQYDLEEAPCVDCLVHFCCPSCALCQEYRELRNRGFDMGIGWEANEDRRRRAATQAPIMTPGMSFGRPSNAVSVLEDEEELRWAAIERFPQHQRTSLALLRRTTSEQGKEASKTETIDVRKLDRFSRELVVRNALAPTEQDNYRLLSAIKERLDRQWGKMRRQVDLKEMKGDSGLKGFALFRQPRLSVVPVLEDVWERVRDLGGGYEGDGQVDRIQDHEEGGGD